MDKTSQLMYIAQNTNAYLQTNARTLDSRLENINLSDKEMDDIVSGKTVKTIRDKSLSFLGGFGEVVSTVLNWNEGINDDITEAKKTMLMGLYFDKVDAQDNAISMLRECLVNPQGNTLFNKVLRILDDAPPDEELMRHLSSALKKIAADGNFESLFDQHKYALAQIERLTPQSLSIISDFRSWPPIKLGTSMSVGPKITSDWYAEFTEAYCHTKNLHDIQKINRVKHSIIELQGQGFMEAYQGENNLTYCKLTAIGEILLPYLQ